MSDVAVRPERLGEAEAIRTVNLRAFGGPLEAAIVDALRGSEGAISLVAIAADSIVGHILFTPVDVDGTQRSIRAAGLAPMAVAPEHQGQGIGSRLVRAGIEACRAAGYQVIVVVGHATYYPRFGFVPGTSKGLECQWPVPPEVFMVLELLPGVLRDVRGIARYRPEFSA